ncbi:MAG: potassium transporter TrkG [Bacteroidales bacterium]
MQIFSIIFSVITIACIICYHGLYISYRFKNIIKLVVYCSLLFYILKYFLLIFYSLHKKAFIRKSWFEFLVICTLTLNFILYYVLQIDINILNLYNFEEYYILFIQFYFLIIVMIELAKVSTSLGKINVSPPTLMMLSFFILIALGALLLMMPRMTTNGISFIDALFTSTSASCVTGLNVLSTSGAFTFKGQVVIMILIQLGGMSILSFATFFTTFLSRSYVGLRYQYLVKDLLSTNKLSDSFMLLREIIIATAIIEAIGVMLLYMYWRTTGFFDSNGETFFYAIFHTISAFNNAGFALWDSSFMNMEISNSYFPQTIIMILVFLGGIGFVTLRDFFNPQFIRERKKYKWKSLMPGSKIVLLTTFLIIILGTIIFFSVEFNNSLTEKTTLFDKMFASCFQVISARTAGFNIVDINMISVPGMLLIMLVMFIGASPGSTGGGIKTTTFFVLIKSVFATIKGKKHIEFDKKNISFDLVDKAYSIVIMSAIIILLSTFTLSILEPEADLVNLLFESISAFSTCGLSTNCQADFGNAAKFILILNMYIGRIGTLTVAFALSKRAKESRHQYPDTYFMIG